MAQPTAKEQELFELLNRMRMNPSQELNYLLNSNDPEVTSALNYFKVDINVLKQQWGSLQAVAPLAWSSALADAATSHNNEMIRQDSQSHQLPGEADFATRAKNAGYGNYSNLGENIYAYGKSLLHIHAGLGIDWGSGPGGIQSPAGHRDNMMSATMREAGISIVEENNPNTQVGNLVTSQEFGSRFDLNGKGYVTGVAFDDKNKDGFYQAGEGLSDVQVKITGVNGTSFTNTINVWGSGGYQELLGSGEYQVDFVRNNAVVGTKKATIGASAQNTKVDFILPVTDLTTPATTTPTAVTPTATTPTAVTPTATTPTAVTPTATTPTAVTPTTTKQTPVTQQTNPFSRTRRRTRSMAARGVSLENPEVAVANEDSTPESGNNILDFSRSENSQPGTIDKVSQEAEYKNDIGFYVVNDLEGTVTDPLSGKTYQPGSNGYIEAALRSVLAEGMTVDGDTQTAMAPLSAGKIYAPLIVANGTIDAALNSQASDKPLVYCDYIAANPDRAEHVKYLGNNMFGFEDLYGGGDRDFNDAVCKVQAPTI
jgi:uncharacterized protein YkwD